jgi:hypothetical protein
MLPLTTLMLALADDAKTFFSKLESDLPLKGEWMGDASKRYRVSWADSLTVSLSRTKAAMSLFGTSFEYYIMLQAEKGCGRSAEEYWRAQAKTCELRFRGKILGRGEPYFQPAAGAQVAEKRHSLHDDSLRKSLDTNPKIQTLLRSCDPVFCAILVYSDEIPDYPFAVGAMVLDYPYEVSYREGRDIFYVVRIEKKVSAPILRNPTKFLELLTHMTMVLE